jgi:tRNA U38,U39,U40 pseudouridine synthase TruA
MAYNVHRYLAGSFNQRRLLFKRGFNMLFQLYARSNTEVIGAGRTDTEVHASFFGGSLQFGQIR